MAEVWNPMVEVWNLGCGWQAPGWKYNEWLVLKARLILGQPKNHVFSQPYSRISTAPPAPSCGNPRIKGRALIERLIDANRKVLGAQVYIKKVLPA